MRARVQSAYPGDPLVKSAAPMMAGFTGGAMSVTLSATDLTALTGR